MFLTVKKGQATLNNLLSLKFTNVKKVVAMRLQYELNQPNNNTTMKSVKSDELFQLKSNLIFVHIFNK